MRSLIIIAALMLGAAVARAEPVTLWCDGEMERVSYSASDKTSHEMTVVVDWQTETAKIDGFDVKLIALAGDNDFVIMGHAGSVDGPKFGIDLGQSPDRRVVGGLQIGGGLLQV